MEQGRSTINIKLIYYGLALQLYQISSNLYETVCFSNLGCIIICIYINR
jgi:hypothetical protein